MAKAASVRVEVKPALLRWARDRADLALDELARVLADQVRNTNIVAARPCIDLACPMHLRAFADGAFGCAKRCEESDDVHSIERNSRWTLICLVRPPW